MHVSNHLKMTLSRRKEEKKETEERGKEEEETINMNIIILPMEDSRCWPLAVANSSTNTSVKPLTSGPRGAEKG